MVNRGEVEGQEVNIEGEGLAVNREELTSISNRKNQVHLLQQIYIFNQRCFHDISFLF